jgi:hypothetical protein
MVCFPSLSDAGIKLRNSHAFQKVTCPYKIVSSARHGFAITLFYQAKPKGFHPDVHYFIGTSLYIIKLLLSIAFSFFYPYLRASPQMTKKHLNIHYVMAQNRQ